MSAQKLLFYLLFFRDWNAVFQYHTIQCLLIFCNTYHRHPSVCSTEPSRFFENGKIWVGRTMLNGDKKENGPSEKEKKKGDTLNLNKDANVS